MSSRPAATAAATFAALACAAAMFICSPALASSCVAGVRTVAGVTQRTFCGPASVSVKINGRTVKLSQGLCVATTKYLSVNIGVWSGPGAKTKTEPNYFGLDIGQPPGGTTPPAGKDGTYTAGSILAFNYAGKSYAMFKSTAVLRGNRTQGTVTGKALTGESIVASFHC